MLSVASGGVAAGPPSGIEWAEYSTGWPPAMSASTSGRALKASIRSWGCTGGLLPLIPRGEPPAKAGPLGNERKAPVGGDDYVGLQLGVGRADPHHPAVVGEK